MVGLVQFICYSPQFELFLLGDFLELSASVLRFHEVVVDGPDPGLLVSILPGPVVVQVFQLGHLILVLSFLLLESLDFVLQVVDFFPQGEALVAFLRGI